jgi:hypothetical protein
VLSHPRHQARLGAWAILRNERAIGACLTLPDRPVRRRSGTYLQPYLSAEIKEKGLAIFIVSP